MTNKNLTIAALRAILLSMSIGLGGCSDAAEAVSPATLAVPEDISPYNTYLFNLLTNKKSLVDGKNHYRRTFDQSFDAMLATSNLAKSSPSAVPLKKRLLSGPQPEPVLVRQKNNRLQYVIYEACQAHACDITKLTVLYSPDLKKMLGRLHLDGKIEYLGNPTPAEKAMLDQSLSTL
jgi:hypothetical protein